MAFLEGLAVASLIALSALGLGQALFSALRLATVLRPGEARPAAFALGVGGLGWLAFFPALFGLLAPLHLLALLIPGWLGLLLPQWRRFEPPALPQDPWIVAGLVLLGLLLAVELIEAAAPPADADTL